MPFPLMPKATAVWLIENTALTFQQIGDFCGMHPLEVQGIADGEVAIGIVGADPIIGGQLEKEEIARCEKDPDAKMQMKPDVRKHIKAKQKGTRYTPVARRQDKPDAIAWLLKNYPTIGDTQIIRLVGTTKNTIQALKDKTHWNMQNIRPRDPVLLGICTQTALDNEIAKLKLQDSAA